MTLLRLAISIAALAVAGCAAEGFIPNAAVTTTRAKMIAPAVTAQDRVIIGKSTRANVLAALGETQVIHFDNGYEVWVYRLGTEGSAAASRISRAYSDKAWPWTPPEYVILFGPSGVVEKTRVRPAS